MHRITPHQPLPLFDSAATGRIERAAAAALPAHQLMQRAGLAVAQLAQALAPYARTVWLGGCDAPAAEGPPGGGPLAGPAGKAPRRCPGLLAARTGRRGAMGRPRPGSAQQLRPVHRRAAGPWSFCIVIA